MPATARRDLVTLAAEDAVLGSGKEAIMRRPRTPRQLIVVAKERAFDEEKWKQLLIALAYVLHERRKAQEPAPPATPSRREAQS